MLPAAEATGPPTSPKEGWIYVGGSYIGWSYMAGGFIGRTAELTLLARRLARVEADRVGSALVIRGRRQVGKSRLAQEFCDTAGIPYLYYTATKGASPVEAITAFLAELRESSLRRDRALIPGEPLGSWADAFRVLASALPDRPAVIVRGSGVSAVRRARGSTAR